MKREALISVLMICAVAAVGCATGSATHVSANSTTNEVIADMSDMPGMSGANNSGTTSGDSSELKRIFDEQFSGLETVQADVSHGDYSGAIKVANQLHDQFHAYILPKLTASKGSQFAEEAHSTYDSLQDAIQSHNPEAISSALDKNRSTLTEVMSILGVH
jgi:hypothetical protein